ncbi:MULTISPECIES: hypothetical protein [unclassified Clostridium]|uniref:hypothetical protein n=1 Tax=unclassified Clostridium TaxID=2614128 RepID=UPI0025BE9D5C|nr:hypothetical protein [Clostridium sp.]MDY2629897.1 hypothetical protein [Clostridium sp.]MDY4253751.1 hypothetical protein [Clostridium sp.]
MDNEEFKEYMEEYIRKLDFETQRLEILGTSLNALGYLIICYGAKIDIYDIITNNEVDINSAEVTLFGQIIIVIGYSILWVVSIRRVYSRKLRNEYLDEKNYIPAYTKLEFSYILSVFSNLLRLEAFYEILMNRELNTEDNEE